VQDVVFSCDMMGMQSVSDDIHTRTRTLIPALTHTNAHVQDVVFSCDMMGMQSVSDDVRGLWFEVTMDVQGRVPVPGDTTELQNAVTKAGEAGDKTTTERGVCKQEKQASMRKG